MNLADSFQNGTYPSWDLLDQFQAAACKDPTKLGLKPAVCIFIPKFPAHHPKDPSPPSLILLISVTFHWEPGTNRHWDTAVVIIARYNLKARSWKNQFPITARILHVAKKSPKGTRTMWHYWASQAIYVQSGNCTNKISTESNNKSLQTS